MKALDQSYVWCPKLDMGIEMTCRVCRTCMLNQNNPSEVPIYYWEYTSQLWERNHIDYAGPYLGYMFSIAVDAYSKQTEVHVMKTPTAAVTVEKMRGIFATLALPSGE